MSSGARVDDYLSCRMVIDFRVNVIGDDGAGYSLAVDSRMAQVAITPVKNSDTPLGRFFDGVSNNAEVMAARNAVIREATMRLEQMLREYLSRGDQVNGYAKSDRIGV